MKATKTSRISTKKTDTKPEDQPVDLVLALASIFDEVSYMDFYRDLFPVGSFETKGIYEPGKYNGIAVCLGKGHKHVKRYTVTDDLDVIDLMASGNDFCLMSPISYVGRSRKADNARFMYALTIDLDGVKTMGQWYFLLKQIEHGHEMRSFVWGLPKPTYLVSSGTGLHLYYVFEQPVPLFANIVEQLEVLKKRLTWQAWTQGASSLHEKVQYESLFQGFRVVGTITKTGTRCRAFKVGSKVSIEYLNNYVPADYQVKTFTYKSDLTLEQAKERYPEWYQKRIVEERPRGTWTCKRDLYDWWIRTLSAGATEGHRYWCIFALATYALKCGIPQEELEEDATSLIPLLSARGDEPFTEADVLAALQACESSYIFYPIWRIEERTGIPIKRNKRNGRKQRDHVLIMNTMKAVKKTLGEDVNEGRPKKESLVYQWRREHPDGTKAQCCRDTGLSKPTVYKWWNSEE